MIDVHAHICDDGLLPFADKIAADMTSDGLSAIIDSSYCPRSAGIALGNARKYARVFCTLGVHPEEYDKYSPEIERNFAQLYRSEKKVVAIGEIGLDYHYPELPKDRQWDVFERQLSLAGSLNAPVVLHVRDAIGDAYSILRNHENDLKGGILLHCYSGSKEMVKQFDRFDCYYSFGGAVTFKNATEKPDVIRAISYDRILLETDCPYMTPVPFRGKINFPAYVRLTCKKIAEILDKSFEDVDQTTEQNAKRLFPRLC